MTTTTTSSANPPVTPHPRIRERRAHVENQSLRSRNRKFVAAGVVVVVGLLAAASTQSALLDVDEVHVVGAVRKSPDYVREVAAVEIGAPLIGLDLAAIEARLEGLPEVASVTATSNWRGVVTIEVAERLPVARMQAPEGTVVIAADGVVLEIADTAYNELPTISGVMFTTTVGDRIPVELGEALTVAAEMPSDIATVTERVEITVDSLVLRMVGGGSVSLGDARDLEAKFDTVRAFLAQVDLACLDTLNVRAPRVPVIVRSQNCR